MSVIQFPGTRSNTVQDLLQMMVDHDSIESIVVVIKTEDGDYHVRYSKQSNATLATAALLLYDEALHQVKK